MVAPTQKTFSQVVSDQVTAIQASAAGLIDFTVGSVLRAVTEAVAQVAMWLQGMILVLLGTTRAATSTGADLDSWMADFGLTRQAATSATGSVTFARFSATSQAVVPIGATVQTSDGSQNFVVTLNTGNAAYNSGLGGYVMAPGTSSVTVPVSASLAGAAGNVVAGAVTIMTTAIPYVDTVTNASAFSGGTNGETDDQFRARFVNYIASLTQGTADAVAYAVQNLGPTAIGVVIENETYAGTPQFGFFTVIADDGTGSPSAGFLTSAQNAVEAVRPLTSTFAVYAPVVTTANVTLNITAVAGYVTTDIKAAVEAAITTYINNLDLQRRTNPRQTSLTLAYSRVYQLAYDATPGVATVSALLINGATADITVAQRGTIRAGTVTATVS